MQIISWHPVGKACCFSICALVTSGSSSILMLFELVMPLAFLGVIVYVWICSLRDIAVGEHIQWCSWNCAMPFLGVDRLWHSHQSCEQPSNASHCREHYWRQGSSTVLARTPSQSLLRSFVMVCFVFTIYIDGCYLHLKAPWLHQLSNLSIGLQAACGLLPPVA